MKRQILIVVFAMQVFLVSPVQAWFPEGVIEFATDARHYCPPGTVSSDDNQDEDKKKQGQTEEEPDCE